MPGMSFLWESQTITMWTSQGRSFVRILEIPEKIGNENPQLVPFPTLILPKHNTLADLIPGDAVLLNLRSCGGKKYFFIPACGLQG